jgi:anti-anti-sigma factor
VVERLDVSAYTVPTHAPEAGGAPVGNSPTIVLVEAAPGTLLVEVRGDLDGEATEQLRAELDRKTAETPASLLLVDLSRVTLLSSAAMRLLLELHRRCRIEGRHLVLVGTGRPAVNRPLRISGLLPLFNTRLTVQSALHRPGGRSRASALRSP